MESRKGQQARMQAVVWEKYGPPGALRCAEVDRPEPSDDEVLINVRATTVSVADTMMRRGDTWMSRVLIGLRAPRRKFRIMGLELAGDIEKTGRRVTRFKRGDRVFGFTGFSLGAYAQHTCLPASASLALMPASLDYEEAASLVDGATTALHFLRDLAGIREGEKVLIIGASGSVGSAAVQLARYFGAKVTGVCSAANLELVKTLGAERAIDYAAEDFTASGEPYDIIFDAASKSSFSRCRGSLTRGGRYLRTVGGLWHYWLTVWTRLFASRRQIFGMSIEKQEALEFVKRLLETGKLRPLIDRRYTLGQIPEAHRYVESGRKRGNVVVTVEQYGDCSVPEPEHRERISTETNRPMPESRHPRRIGAGSDHPVPSDREHEGAVS